MATRRTTKLPKRSVTLHVRVEEELATQIEALALTEERTVSFFIARVLRQYVESEKRSRVIGAKQS